MTMETSRPMPAFPPAGTISFDVFGEPAGQGSKRPRFKKNGEFSHLTEMSNKVKPWRSAVSSAALDAMGGRLPWEGPVFIAIEVWAPRPPATPKRKIRFWKVTMPDLDKVVRATFDGLTGIVAQDDRQFCLLAASKLLEPNRRSGARITAFPMATLEEGGFEVRLEPVLIDRNGVLPAWFPFLSKGAA